MMSATNCSKSAFSKRLQQDGPILLDGGLGTQLEKQGCEIDGELWSAALLQTNSDAIVAVHRAYLQAGAECITTVSYQASRDAYAKQGVSADDADKLMLLSIQLAKQARGEAGSGALIAASLGPYGARLNDGSEYRGDYNVTLNVLRDFHAHRIRLFENSDADVLAFETIPSFDEARVLAELLSDCALPTWVSFSCKDALHICDGSAIADAAALFSGHPTVKAVGVNCTSPQYIRAIIGEFRRVAPDLQVIAYPNSGETYNAGNGSWSGTVTPVDCAAAATEWVAAGAKIVGGCCRMGPAHIAAMAAALGKQCG